MLPTLLAAVGDSTVNEDLLKCKAVGGWNYKVHLDVYNLMPVLRDRGKSGRGESFFTGPMMAKSRYCLRNIGK